MVSNGLNRKAQNAKPCGCTHIVRLRTHMKCAACINEEMLYLSDWRACVLIAVETTDKELKGPRLKALPPGGCAEVGCSSSNLVDPASSHMLVSKVKPCMS